MDTQRNIVIITGSYGTWKTTMLSRLANTLRLPSLIFDFTVNRQSEQLKFVQPPAIRLMWCNGCVDTQAYAEAIVDTLGVGNTLLVECPNDRINLIPLIQNLQSQWISVQVLSTQESTQWKIIQSFADLNISLAKFVSNPIFLQEICVGYNADIFQSFQDTSLESSDNHNAWWLLKPLFNENDLTWLQSFVDRNHSHIERLKGQFYYQWDKTLQSWRYDYERSKDYLLKMSLLNKCGIFSHQLALVSIDQTTRKNFNDYFLRKYVDNQKKTIALTASSINKPKTLCYEVLLWWAEQLQSLLQRVFSNTLLEDDYDYWLVFADSTKKWMSHFINDEQRKAYYRAYYIKKVQTLKEFGSLTSGNYNQYLLTLANVVYLLRSTTRQEITIDDSLQNDVFWLFSQEQRMQLVGEWLNYCDNLWIREFSYERVEWYKEVIDNFTT
jgi:hypothetical protein